MDRFTQTWLQFGSLGANEEASVRCLIEANRQTMNLNEKGNGMIAYLGAIEATAEALQLKPSPRTYRFNFPQKYRELFPGESRSYRADVLEAGLQHYNAIWVNGEKFEFSADTARLAEELQRTWMDQATLLERLWQEPQHAPLGRNVKADLSAALDALDIAWSNFEQRYICELAEIESKARSWIIVAIDCEKQLQDLERRREDGPDAENRYMTKLDFLVRAISRLNSIANIHGKGRDDLRLTVLMQAKTILNDQSLDTIPSDSKGGCRCLAADVLNAFNDIRCYLRKLSCCLETIDPHLSNNSGLTSRLAEWEECWEIGTTYLENQDALAALCDAVSAVRKAQIFAPSLNEMLEACDVQLFLVLPRLVWLRFLANPQTQMTLFARLLPQHFADATGGSPSPSFGPEIHLFVERYTVMMRSLENALEDQIHEDADKSELARSLLVKRVIDGNDHAEDIFLPVPVASRACVRSEVESVIHELEPWSLELQRHCPEDWNQYSAILVRCLRSQGGRDDRNGPFGV